MNTMMIDVARQIIRVGRSYLPVRGDRYLLVTTPCIGNKENSCNLLLIYG